MPVISKAKACMLMRELDTRYSNLKEYLNTRTLHSNTEGCKKGFWKSPESMCSTMGNTTEISLAIEDFKSILVELKKLK